MISDILIYMHESYLALVFFFQWQHFVFNAYFKKIFYIGGALRATAIVLGNGISNVTLNPGQSHFFQINVVWKCITWSILTPIIYK